MSQLNVGTLNVGTTQFTGDSSTLNTAPPTSLSGFVTGTPSSNQVLMWNGIAWVPAAMGGRLLSMNVYTSQNGTWNSYTTTGGSGTWNKPTGCNNVLYMSQVVAVVQDVMITTIVVQVAVAVALLLNSLTSQELAA